MLNYALKLIRLFHGETQQELAKALGISVSYLSELEAGNRRINFELIQKYSDNFDIPASSLLLFSERIEAGEKTKTRIHMADKVIKIMEWVAEKGELANEPPKKSKRLRTGSIPHL